MHYMFTVHALVCHVDLKSLAELGVTKIIPSRLTGIPRFFFCSIRKSKKIELRISDERSVGLMFMT